MFKTTSEPGYQESRMRTRVDKGQRLLQSGDKERRICDIRLASIPSTPPHSCAVQ